MLRYLSLIKITGFVVLPVALLLLPADHFDKGQTICLSVLLAGEQCYGCGLTRGIQHLLHGDIETAASYNKLSFIVLPVLGIYWGWLLNKEVRLFINR